MLIITLLQYLGNNEKRLCVFNTGAFFLSFMNSQLNTQCVTHRIGGIVTVTYLGFSVFPVTCVLLWILLWLNLWRFSLLAPLVIQHPFSIGIFLSSHRVFISLRLPLVFLIWNHFPLMSSGSTVKYSKCPWLLIRILISFFENINFRMWKVPPFFIIIHF